jgi:NAD(P)-dependent dehydrogenase (short-subunit alcohol dehydrogenase family)
VVNTQKSVLITGSSSGIGKAAAIFFASRGWQVAATMRDPSRAGDLREISNIQVYALDVTDSASIETAVAAVIGDLGGIDVLVNNAGFAIDGVFEAMTDAQIISQFDTNVFGLMRMTRSVMPHFRDRGGGTIVQIASVGGKVTFPLYSIYHGTKWAVEGFSESLAYELAPFNIRIKIIEPGAIATEFYGRNRQFVTREDLPFYDDFVGKVDRVSQDAGKNGVAPEVVAKAIFQAANDRTKKLRYPIGFPAPLLLPLRKLLPDTLYFWITRTLYKI